MLPYLGALKGVVRAGGGFRQARIGDHEIVCVCGRRLFDCLVGT